MDVGSVVNQGLIGMQRSQNEIARSAQQIASANVTEPRSDSKVKDSGKDLTEPLVNIKAQTQVFNASAKVVKAAHETIGTLLHVKA